MNINKCGHRYTRTTQKQHGYLKTTLHYSSTSYKSKLMYNFVVVLQLSVLQLHLNVILKRKVTRGLSMGLNLQHQNFMLESCNYFILYSVLLYSISTLKGIPHLQNDNSCINHSLCYPEIIKKILLFLHAVIVSTESLKCEQSS